MSGKHLFNNAGVRSHSASNEFAKTGIIRFSMGNNPTVRMVKFPDGKEITEKEFNETKNKK